MGMNKNSSDVSSLMVPIAEGNLLVPNAAVAEVISFRDIDAGTEISDWIPGMITWREQRVPLINFERAANLRASNMANRKRRILVIKTLSGDRELPFIAVLVHGMPRLTRVGEHNVEDAQVDSNLPSPYVAGRVSINGESAFIPNLVLLEQQAKQLMQAEVAHS